MADGGHPVRLLCVDDDSDTLKTRQILFESHGYSVLTAASGLEALGVLEQGANPDLVVLDYQMPSMDGDELANTLRQRYPQLPLVVVSGAELPSAFRQAVDASVPKGADPELLLGTVSDTLARSQRASQQEAAAQKIVLCVEDEELQLKARKMLFEAAGYHVLEARSAKAAVEMFKSHPIDAVVMDYWLSGEGGHGTAAAEQMKRLRPRTPIVMFSGFSALPGESAMVDAWMRKAGLDPENLVNEVDRLIKLRNFHTQGKKAE